MTDASRKSMFKVVLERLILSVDIGHGAICSVHHFDTNTQVEWYATFLLLTSIVFMYFFNPSALIMS